jgi:VWFA-related protein
MQSAYAGNNRIDLNVVVTAKSGAPVGDLKQQDFTLLNNKTPQTITSFKAVTAREAPIEVMLVIDAINADYEGIGYERTQVDKFLRAEGGNLGYPIALAIVTDKGPQLLGQFSNDGNALSAELSKTEVALRSIPRSTGNWGAAERLKLSIKSLGELAVLEAPRPGRKIMIWVSPGWPLLSGPQSDIYQDQKRIFENIVQVSSLLLQANVTVYSVNPSGNTESLSRVSYYKSFLKGMSNPSKVEMGDLGLPVLAFQSGGLVLNFNNDVAELLQRCIADAAPYYRISFVPAPSDKRDEYHELEIKLADPALTARTRQGYYAQPLAHD